MAWLLGLHATYNAYSAPKAIQLVYLAIAPTNGRGQRLEERARQYRRPSLGWLGQTFGVSECDEKRSHLSHR